MHCSALENLQQHVYKDRRRTARVSGSGAVPGAINNTLSPFLSFH